MLGSYSDHSRIILGSCSDRPRLVNDASPVLEEFLRNVRESFCVAGVYLRCWRETSVAPRIVNDVSYVTRINHESHLRARPSIW